MKDARLERNLLVFLEKLPPFEYLTNCLTDDQKDHWRLLKLRYSMLHQSFQEYFTGQAESQYWTLDKNEREFYALFRDYYLAFYTLIQWHWKEIENSFQAHGQDLNGFASSPGEALIRAMENDCCMFFLECTLPYYKWTPSRARKLRKKDREIQQAKNLAKGHISPELEREIKAYHRERDLVLPPTRYYPPMAFRECCIDVCEGINDPTGDLYLKNYKRASLELDAKIQSLIHPSKKIKGYEWKNGMRRISNRYGGGCS